MSPVELPAGVLHGTPEGHEAGCKGENQCPALRTHGMTCTHAYVRSTTTPDRYFKAKARDPRPEAIARTLGFRPPRPDEPLDLLKEDEAFAARSAAQRARHTERPPAEATPPTATEPRSVEVLVERPDEPAGALNEAAAQPLAERSNDPRGSDETPVVDDPAAVHVPGDDVAEGEGMGHPTPTSTDKPKPTPDDEKRRRAEIRAWAAEHGITVAPVGRISHDVVVAWLHDDPAMVTAKPQPTSKPTKAKGARTSKGGNKRKAGQNPAPQPRAATNSADRFTIGLTPRQKAAKLREIREWARDNGFIEIPTHGKIPGGALAAYAAAHAPAADVVPDAATSDELAEPGTPAPAQADQQALDLPAYLRTDVIFEAEILEETKARIDGAERPDWGTVAASADVEHARETAARLFLELTDAEAQRDQALAALELALQKWDERREAARRLEVHLALSRTAVEFLREAHNTLDRTARDLGDRLAESVAESRGLKTTLDLQRLLLQESERKQSELLAERDHLRGVIESAATSSHRRRRQLRKAAS